MEFSRSKAMPTITVKNIPDDLYAHLKQSAGMNHRSINSEIIVCIERTLLSRRISPETVIPRAQRLREKTRKRCITDAEFTKAKVAGRP
jgi:plasmid stability protein